MTAYDVQSDQVGRLMPALVAAQAQLVNVHKDGRNPQTNSSYADLTSILDMLRPVLAAHGLAVVQAPYADPATDRVVLLSTLYHESGEWVRSVTPVNGRKQLSRDQGGGLEARDDMQTIGAAITYARRYALVAMLGIGQEDDDGNTAAGRTDAPQRRQSPQRPAPGARAQAAATTASTTTSSTATTDAQRRLLAVILRAAGFDLTDDQQKADARRFVAYLAGMEKLDSLNDLPRRKASELLDALGGKDYDPATLQRAVADWRGPAPKGA